MWAWVNEKYVRVDVPASEHVSPTPIQTSNLEQDAPIVKETIMLGTDHECECHGCHPICLTLEEQLQQFEDRKLHVLQEMREELYDEVFLEEVFAMARQRLIDGYELYRSQMYNWDAPERKRNEKEEVADRMVYGTSNGC